MIGCSTLQVTLDAAQAVPPAEGYHADTIYPGIDYLPTEERKACPERNIPVNIWAIGSPKEMTKAVKLRANGTSTNVHGRAITYLFGLGVPTIDEIKLKMTHENSRECER